MCYYLLLGKSSTVSLLGLPHYINAHCDFRPSFTWEFGAKVDFLPGSWEVQQLTEKGPCDLLDTAHLWEPRWVRKAKVEYIWVHIYIYTYWYDLICTVCVCIYIYIPNYINHVGGINLMKNAANRSTSINRREPAQERCDFLIKEIQSKRPLLPAEMEMSEMVREILSTYQSPDGKPWCFPHGETDLPGCVHIDELQGISSFFWCEKRYVFPRWFKFNRIK